MCSIQRTGAADSSNALQWNRPTARVRSREESAQSSLTLKVRTAEGDTVELSLDATSVRQHQSGFARSANGQASYSGTSRADSVNFKATINGDLNDQEMGDIVSLLHSLGTGDASASPLSSLAAYSGALIRTTASSNSLVRIYA